ncbi:MAG: hypothetical protein ACRDOX_08620 [Nocardioides sp.]
MEWLLVLVVLVVLVMGSRVARRSLGTRREVRLQESDRLRLSRKAADEDVTVFGEELTELHFETLTTELDDDMRGDYQRALDSYERAKELVRSVAAPEQVRTVTSTLEDGRFAQACLLARRDGAPLPDRRPPCFFNPNHGPARTEVMWAPPGGVVREIQVCLMDAHRLEEGLAPEIRLVRLGNRRVPWFMSGPAYESYALGYYGAAVESGRLQADRLTGIYGGAIAGGPGEWSAWNDPGAWDGGGMIGGHDYSGYDGGGDHGGLFDGGLHGGGGGDGGDGGGGGGDG